ncbi:MAG: hypothetical protein K2W99_08595 [Chthoniobacterales bacterium]|nr:hypothetical protein [Chthoniobacterales bacterium]
MKKLPFFFVLSLLVISPWRGNAMVGGGERPVEESEGNGLKKKGVLEYSKEVEEKVLIANVGVSRDLSSPKKALFKHQGSRSDFNQEEIVGSSGNSGVGGNLENANAQNLFDPEVLAAREEEASEVLSFLNENPSEVVAEEVRVFWQERHQDYKEALSQARGKELLSDEDLDKLKNLGKIAGKIVKMIEDRVPPAESSRVEHNLLPEFESEHVNNPHEKAPLLSRKSSSDSSYDSHGPSGERKRSSFSQRPAPFLEEEEFATSQAYEITLKAHQHFWQEWEARGKKVKELKKQQEEKEKAIQKATKKKEALRKSLQTAQKNICEKQTSLNNVNPLNPWSKSRREERLAQATRDHAVIEREATKVKKNLAALILEKEALVEAEKKARDWEGIIPEEERKAFKPTENESILWESTFLRIALRERERFNQDGRAVVYTGPKPSLTDDRTILEKQKDMVLQKLKNLVKKEFQINELLPQDIIGTSRESLVIIAQRGHEMPEEELQQMASRLPQYKEATLREDIEYTKYFLNNCLSCIGEKLAKEIKDDDYYETIETAQCLYRRLVEFDHPLVEALRFLSLPTSELEENVNRLAELSEEERRFESVGVSEPTLTGKKIFTDAPRVHESYEQERKRKNREFQEQKDLEAKKAAEEKRLRQEKEQEELKKEKEARQKAWEETQARRNATSRNGLSSSLAMQNFIIQSNNQQQQFMIQQQQRLYNNAFIAQSNYNTSVMSYNFQQMAMGNNNNFKPFK